MKKTIFSLLVIGLILLSVTGCGTEKVESNADALKFKEEYEAINGVANSSGKEHRTLSISEDNPFVYVTGEEIVEKIENNETFYVYFGSPYCPWCRSVIEKSIEVAKKNNIDKIYYIEIWDDDGNEILRDKYELQDGQPVKIQDGTDEYYKLLDSLKSVLSDYTLSDEEENKIEVGEKRIYAPNYFYISNGKVKKMVEGISDKQKDSREELTDEILKDEEEQFNDLFKNSCDENC